MRSPNLYANLQLDRLDPLRQDPGWLEQSLFDTNSKLLLVWRDRHLMLSETEPAILSPAGNEHFLASANEIALLGRDSQDSLWFGLDFSHLDQEQIPTPDSIDANWRGLRSIGTLLDAKTGALLGYLNALMRWHRRHRFCGSCGCPTESQRSGHVRHCTNTDCAKDHYPRTDPAIIVLIEHENKLLLGRQHWWNPGMHSLLAGYVEPGESLEDAVRREVAEEVGVGLTDIRYHSSQPWPFSSSIMLGFLARATTTEIHLNSDELEAADWFSREQLTHSKDPSKLHLPRKDSIARRIIEEWIADSL